jgi:hypothetical protein
VKTFSLLKRARTGQLERITIARFPTVDVKRARREANAPRPESMNGYLAAALAMSAEDRTDWQTTKRPPDLRAPSGRLARHCPIARWTSLTRQACPAYRHHHAHRLGLGERQSERGQQDVQLTHGDFAQAGKALHGRAR